MNYRNKRFLNESNVAYDDAAYKLRQMMSSKTGYKDFVNQLNKTLRSDTGEFVDILRAGRKDGREADEIVSLKLGITRPVKLRPTQSEIGLDQSLKTLVSNPFKNADIMFSGNAHTVSAFDPVLIYNGKYIIDGHHRWSQIYCGNPNGKIKVLNMTVKGHPDANDPQFALKVSQLAIAANVRFIKSNPMGGSNMLEATYSTIDSYVRSIVDINRGKFGSLPEYVSAVLGETFTRQNADRYLSSYIDYIYNNIKTMQVKSPPASNATKRDYMPQMDFAPKFIDMMKKGVINFIDPHPSDASSHVSMGDAGLKFRSPSDEKAASKYYYEGYDSKLREIIREEVRRYLNK